MEGGPHRWEPGAPGSPDWCYYCEKLKTDRPGALRPMVAGDLLTVLYPMPGMVAS
jgi:hypothetical protein